jgi:trigger factor
MLPEFETALTGMKFGETKTFELTFPADYHGKEVAGKKAQFELTAKTVEQGFAPDVDEEFARAFGIASGSVDELRAEIAANLRLELKRKIEAMVKEQAFGALRQKAMFVGAEVAGRRPRCRTMMQRMTAEMREQGVKPEDANLDSESRAHGSEGPRRARAHPFRRSCAPKTWARSRSR